MAKLNLACLGRFQASFGECISLHFRTIKVQALLIYLAVEAVGGAKVLDIGINHRREALMELLWSGQPLKAARQNLRQALYQLRKAIPDQQSEDGSAIEFIRSNRVTIGINPDYAFDLDVAVFTHYLQKGDLEAAVSLYRGDFLSGFYLPDSSEFESWAQVRRSTYLRQALQALNSLTVEHLQKGQVERALTFASRQLALDDLNERAHRQVMEALSRLGRREAALAQYDTCRQLLGDELGVEPDRATEKLRAQIQRGEITTVDGRSTRAAAVPRGMPQRAREAQPPRFVCREAELAALNRALERAEAGNGHPHFVVAGAGRGKTALVGAFASKALASHPDLLVISGACRGPAASGEPYLPFRHILAQLSGEVSGSAVLSREQAERLWTAMAETIPLLVEYGPDLIGALLSGEELRYRAATISSSQSAWFRRLCRLLDQDDEEKPRRDRLLSEVTDTLRMVAGERPLLLILEDLHWVDAASAALFMHLSLELKKSRILFLGTYRPEEINTTDDHPLLPILGELKRQFGGVWIDLGSEETGEGRRFIDVYLDAEANDLDEAFREKLYAHTGGHALFTVELLRAMQERGEIAPDKAGRWQIQELLSWEDLPPKVEGVIERRFGRLDPELQSALSVAAVEGETFTAAIIAEIQGLDERRLVRRLSQEVERQHRLVQAERLEWRSGRRLARYRFRHQLFQQYLYQKLDEIEKAYLHEAIGLKLEEICPEERRPVAALAWHFDQAGNVEKAIPYLLQAGDKARLLYASKEAVSHYEQALALLKDKGDFDQAAHVLLKLGLTHMNAFDFEAALRTYNESFNFDRKATQPVVKPILPPAPHPLRLIFTHKLTPLNLINTGVVKTGMFPGLVRFTVDLDVVPDIAKSWEILDGGRIFRFHLRSDIVWSDGHPVTAHDFVYAWRRALDPKRGSMYAEYLHDIVGAADYHQGREKNSLSLGLKALDDHTFEVKLTQPIAYFLQILASSVAAVVPQHTVDECGETWVDPENIVSCGPFLLQSGNEDSIFFTRNPDYYGRFSGNVERVELRHYSSLEEGLQLFSEDQVDFISLDTTHLSMLEQITRLYAADYQTGLRMMTDALVFNVEFPPFDNSIVRRAFAYATDRSRLNGISRGIPVGGGFVPPEMPGHVPAIALPYDVSKARQLMSEAGYSGAKKCPTLHVALMRTGTPFIPEYVLKPWEEIFGVKIAWKEIAWTEYFEYLRCEEPHIFNLAWMADLPDPDNFLRVALGDMSKWRNEAYVALIEEARCSTDHEHRFKLFREAEEILVQEAPILPLVYVKYHVLVKPWIRNLELNPSKSQTWQQAIVQPH